MHFNHFSKDLMSIHVWRQTQTQSTINNFYEEDMNILNPRRNNRGATEGLFRMEFPLMQWLVAAQYKVFGNHLIISRIFMFIIGLFSVFGIYYLLNALFKNTTLAVIGAWTFNFSPSFYYYTINPLPDNLALCCSIWGVGLFFDWLTSKKLKNLLLSGLLLSIGALCKLPFIIYYSIPFVYFLILAIKKGLNTKLLTQAIGVLGLAILPLLWYAWVIPQWDENPIVEGMFNNRESIQNLLGYYKFNLISTLPELLINYGSVLFFLAGFYFLYKRKSYKNTTFILILSLCFFVLIYYFFEANAIGAIHDYYLFPFYPLIFMLVAYGAYHLYNFNKKPLQYFTLFLLLMLPFTCYLRMQNRWDTESPGFNKDLLLYKTELRNAIPKDALVVAGNDKSDFIFFYYIDKKGWGFNNDDLTSNTLESMITEGAEFIYTDSKEIYTNNELTPYFDELIIEKGSIKLFKLKKD